VFVKTIVEFLEFGLPPGFPVKIGALFLFSFFFFNVDPTSHFSLFFFSYTEVPVLPMISVQVTFHDIVDNAASADDFLVPVDYIEAGRVAECPPPPPS